MWCVLMTGPDADRNVENLLRDSTPSTRGAMNSALRRARAASAAQVAVVAAPGRMTVELRASGQFNTENFFDQPDFRGSAYEVLLALLALEGRVDATTPVLFMPTDHVVRQEQVMVQALANVGSWVQRDPSLVYLLGAAPEGPHNQLGYIVPWYDAHDLASAVYSFVEGPETHRARQLINAGALWNTFIFAGTIPALLELFGHAHQQPVVDALRAALRQAPTDAGSALAALYQNLEWLDFSRDILIPNVDRLGLLRLPRCGWWPLKGPVAAPGNDADDEDDAQWAAANAH
jgi:mannose-1-phosphate guanylyltransferase